MANVYTREGKKGIQIYFDYKTPENPRKRVPSGIYLSGSKMHQKKQLAEALLMAQELEEEAKKKKKTAKVSKPRKKVVTVEEFINNAQAGISQRTLECMSSYKTAFIKWLRDNRLHNIAFQDITKEHAEAYLVHLVKSMKLSSAKTYYAWIKVMFNNAVDDELIDRNPFLLSKRKLNRIYGQVDDNSSAAAFSISELHKLLNCEDKLVADLTLLTFLCNGRRLNEIYKLTWEDIDFEERIITFETSKTNQTCYVYICDRLMELLLQLKKSHKSKTVLPHRVATIKGNSTTLTMDLLSRRMRRMLVILGIIEDKKGYSGYGHHSIRRSVETLLTERFDFARADVLVGHAAKTVGAKHYYKPTNEFYKEAAEYLESLVAS